MKPFLVGITGPICGGKSTLVEMLKHRGFYVIKADLVAKELLYTSENKPWLTELMGESIITSNGAYDFSRIREVIFSHPQTLHAINRYTSQHVWPEIERRVRLSKSLIVFVENALLFEDSWEDNFNLTICVYCDEEESVRRMQRSRNIAKDIANEIISTQLPVMEKVARADFKIDTTYLKRDEKYKSLELLLHMFQERYPYIFPKQ